MDYVYRFPVVRGIQAGSEYYIAMVPLKMLSKLFSTDEEEYIPPEYRAQRRLNENRIPVISKYILDNRENYVFSALAASIDGEFEFKNNKTNDDTGILEVSMDAHFLINDGQHRKSAIMAALKEDKSLENETISIVFYADNGLERSQQIFTDLNKNAVRTSNSIAELYDSRDELAVVTRNVVSQISFLNEYTDKERDILGKFSSSLFTLNTFYSANKIIINSATIDKNVEDFLLLFWTSIVRYMLPWQELKNKNITKRDLRENYIATQNVVIQALARVGQYLYKNGLKPEEYCTNIEKINWNRNAKQWMERAIASNGRIITNKKAALLISNLIKKTMGIELSVDEKEEEKKLRNRINSRVK